MRKTTAGSHCRMDEFHRSASSLEEELEEAVEGAEETIASMTAFMGEVTQKYNITPEDYEDVEAAYPEEIKRPDRFEKSQPQAEPKVRLPETSVKPEPEMEPEPEPEPPKAQRAPVKTPTVVLPSESPISKPPEPPEVKRSSRIQRVRRNVLDEKPEKQPPPPPPPPKVQPPIPVKKSQTQPLQPLQISKAQTKELKENIKEISKTVDEAKKSFRKIAGSFTLGLKGATVGVAQKMLDNSQKLFEKVTSWVSAFPQKKGRPDDLEMLDEDFEDEPIDNTEAETSSSASDFHPPPASVTRQESPESRLFKKIPGVAPTLYSELIKQNISFLTLDKKPMVLEAAQKSPDEVQEIFIEKALSEVKASAQYVEAFEPPEEGYYAHIPVAYIFRHVRERDIYLFLHYVKQSPDIFRVKKYKFAEAFASWVLKKSHEVEVTDEDRYEYNDDYEDYELPREEQPPEPEPEEEEGRYIPDNIPPLLYANLLKQGIEFFSMNRESLIGNPRLHPDVIQSLFMEKANAEIKGCVRMVEKLPPPTKGPYQGFPLKDIFSTVHEQDIYFFLHFVATNPELFQNKDYRLAEAFASWILKNAHETELYDPAKHGANTPLKTHHSRIPDTIPPIIYTELLQQDIAFLTFDKQPLVSMTDTTLRGIQETFLRNVMRDVRYCIKFVKNLPELKKGPYAGFKVADIFRNVQPQDIYFFLHYVQAKPEPFIGKNFKFSEAFASWLIKRSHDTKIL